VNGVIPECLLCSPLFEDSSTMTVLSFSKKRWDENTGFSPHCTFEILEN
jgi:hypothetical protein